MKKKYFQEKLISDVWNLVCGFNILGLTLLIYNTFKDKEREEQPLAFKDCEKMTLKLKVHFYPIKSHQDSFSLTHRWRSESFTSCPQESQAYFLYKTIAIFC